jgi:hypothetical protein
LVNDNIHQRWKHIIIPYWNRNKLKVPNHHVDYCYYLVSFIKSIVFSHPIYNPTNFFSFVNTTTHSLYNWQLDFDMSLEPFRVFWNSFYKPRFIKTFKSFKSKLLKILKVINDLIDSVLLRFHLFFLRPNFFFSLVFVWPIKFFTHSLYFVIFLFWGYFKSFLKYLIRLKNWADRWSHWSRTYSSWYVSEIFRQFNYNLGLVESLTKFEGSFYFYGLVKRGFDPWEDRGDYMFILNRYVDNKYLFYTNFLHYFFDIIQLIIYLLFFPFFWFYTTIGLVSKQNLLRNFFRKSLFNFLIFFKNFLKKFFYWGFLKKTPWYFFWNCFDFERGFKKTSSFIKIKHSNYFKRKSKKLLPVSTLFDSQSSDLSSTFFFRYKDHLNRNVDIIRFQKNFFSNNIYFADPTYVINHKSSDSIRFFLTTLFTHIYGGHIYYFLFKNCSHLGIDYFNSRSNFFKKLRGKPYSLKFLHRFKLGVFNTWNRNLYLSNLNSKTFFFEPNNSFSFDSKLSKFLFEYRSFYIRLFKPKWHKIVFKKFIFFIFFWWFFERFNKNIFWTVIYQFISRTWLINLRTFHGKSRIDCYFSMSSHYNTISNDFFDRWLWEPSTYRSHTFIKARPRSVRFGKLRWFTHKTLVNFWHMGGHASLFSHNFLDNDMEFFPSGVEQPLSISQKRFWGRGWKINNSYDYNWFASTHNSFNHNFLHVFEKHHSHSDWLDYIYYFL